MNGKSKALKQVPVVLFVGTGDETLMKAHEGEVHREAAIRLMLEAQKKDFAIICTDQGEEFLKQASERGVDTRKISFIMGGSFSSGGFYDHMRRCNISPSLVVVAGHFRTGCENHGIENVLSMTYSLGARVKENKPIVKWVVGPASFSNPLSDKGFNRLSLRGVEPITFQQFRHMNAQGKYLDAGGKPLKDARGKSLAKLDRLYFSKPVRRSIYSQRASVRYHHKALMEGLTRSDLPGPVKARALGVMERISKRRR